MNDPHSTEAVGQRMLAAIMFTDVVQFSRRVGEDEERALRLIQRDLAAISATVKQFSGRILKHTGDGCMAFFNSGVQAVECAQAIQRHFTEQAQVMPPDETLEHRIGIHLGDVFITGREVMGDGVNIAARLQTEAPAGGICISQALYEVVKTRLALHTIHLGSRQLKNIAEDVVIYQIAINGQGIPPMAHEPQEPAPAATPTPTPAAPAWIVPVIAIGVVALLATGYWLAKGAVFSPVSPQAHVVLPHRQQVPASGSAENQPPALPDPGEPAPETPASSPDAQPAVDAPPAVPSIASDNPGARPADYGPSAPPAAPSTTEYATYEEAKSHYLVTRDYPSLRDWMIRHSQATIPPEEAAKYRQLAELYDWIDRELLPYSENAPLVLKTQSLGEVKVWNVPGGQIGLDTSYTGRIQTTLDRLPKPQYIITLALGMLHAKWSTPATRNPVEARANLAAVKLYATENNLPLPPLVERLERLIGPAQ